MEPNAINPIALIIAIAACTFTITGVIVAMFLWLRSEANIDRRNFQVSLETHRSEFQSALETHRRDFQSFLDAQRKEMVELAHAINNEVKDFHYRLLEIEKRK